MGTDKVALITAGGSGMGAAAARNLRQTVTALPCSRPLARVKHWPDHLEGWA